MDAVEIEEAVSALVEQPFNADEFPFSFLSAFGNEDFVIMPLSKKGGGCCESIVKHHREDSVILQLFFCG